MHIKQISTIPALEQFIRDLANSSSGPVQQMLKAQLYVISSFTAPTLIDSVISRMIECLYIALEECTNDNEKKLVRRQFTSMIETLIFLLDAKVIAIQEESEEFAINTIVQAGSLFMNNLQDLMLIAVNTFSTATKIVATTFDHAGTTLAVMANNGITQISETIAGSSFTLADTITNETCPEGQTKTSQSLSFSKDASSNETINAIERTGEKTVNIIESNRGKYSKSINPYIDDWNNQLTKYIITDVFSPERAEVRRSFFENFLILTTGLNKKKAEEKQVEFFKTICATIEKLDKYYPLIGKSIIISDMIERYVKVIESKNDFKIKNNLFSTMETGTLAAGTLVAASSFFSPIIRAGSALVGMAFSAFIHRQTSIGRDPKDAIKAYKKTAEKYNIMS